MSCREQIRGITEVHKIVYKIKKKVENYPGLVHLSYSIIIFRKIIGKD